jgi:hypothetical protein
MDNDDTVTQCGEERRIGGSRNLLRDWHLIEACTGTGGQNGWDWSTIDKQGYESCMSVDTVGLGRLYFADIQG